MRTIPVKYNIIYGYSDNPIKSRLIHQVFNLVTYISYNKNTAYTAILNNYFFILSIYPVRLPRWFTNSYTYIDIET